MAIPGVNKNDIKLVFLKEILKSNILKKSKQMDKLI